MYMNKENAQLENSHEKILRIARDLFMELGYKAVSTRKIAEECGITQPTLYHHYKNKQELYAEVLKSQLFRARDDLHNIIEQHEEIAEKCIFELSLYILMTKPIAMGQMFSDIAHNLPEEHQKNLAKWWMECYLKPITGVFEKGIADGQIRKPNEFGSQPEACARMLLNLLASHPARKPMDEEETRKMVSMYTNILFHGLAASPKG